MQFLPRVLKRRANMNTENKNDTVAQNQDGTAQAADSDLTTGPGLITNSELITASEPITDHCPTATPARFESRGRVSKVALLPVEIREFINEQLLYGTPFFIIVQALDERGYPGFNHHNLRSWQGHGFQLWLKNHQSMAQQVHRREAALAHAQATGCRLDEALYQLNLENLFQAASQLDPVELVKASEDKAELFFKINEGCVRLLKVGEGFKKSTRMEGSTRVQPSARTGWEREKNGGLTAEEHAAVRRKLGIRPPSPVTNPDSIKPEPVPEKQP